VNTAYYLLYSCQVEVQNAIAIPADYAAMAQEQYSSTKN
jgi:hypothetical protein